jgi:hypothetical protein
MNWGYKIMLVYILFVVGILFLVFKTTKESNDLVTKDYYAKELKYQQVIDDAKRTSNLSSTPLINILNDSLEITFPKEFDNKLLKGTIDVYYAADEKKDFSTTIETTQSNFKIKIPQKNKGLHEVHLKWQVEAINYYFEKKIFI